MELFCIGRSARRECALNRSVGGEVVVPGFGASDCRKGCGSHLRFLGAQRANGGTVARAGRAAARKPAASAWRVSIGYIPSVVRIVAGESPMMALTPASVTRRMSAGSLTVQVFTPIPRLRRAAVSAFVTIDFSGWRKACGMKGASQTWRSQTGMRGDTGCRRDLRGQPGQLAQRERVERREHHPLLDGVAFDDFDDGLFQPVVAGAVVGDPDIHQHIPADLLEDLVEG